MARHRWILLLVAGALVSPLVAGVGQASADPPSPAAEARAAAKLLPHVSDEDAKATLPLSVVMAEIVDEFSSFSSYVIEGDEAVISFRGVAPPGAVERIRATGVPHQIRGGSVTSFEEQEAALRHVHRLAMDASSGRHVTSSVVSETEILVSIAGAGGSAGKNLLSTLSGSLNQEVKLISAAMTVRVESREDFGESTQAFGPIGATTLTRHGG